MEAVRRCGYQPEANLADSAANFHATATDRNLATCLALCDAPHTARLAVGAPGALAWGLSLLDPPLSLPGGLPTVLF